MGIATAADQFELPADVSLVPVRDRVVCPLMVMPLVVSRTCSATDRAGIETVLFPAANISEFEAQPPTLRRRGRRVPCHTVEELFREGLVDADSHPLSLARSN